ncbi:MAG: Nif3-like dinuclear metal center hexameric protein [Ignavibacteria bacterium]|nr:Nif3-like dinuclear metal center hexameric protein [Ignavibacteria bacterium]
MTITELNDRLNELFPPETAWSGDAIGLQIGRYPSNLEIRNLLVAYEINQDVISEAALHDIDCICVFHPLIFSPLRTITRQDRVSSHVHDLIRYNIGLIVVHTNFDTHPRGTNALAAQSLGLERSTLRPLIPDKNLEQFGMGIIGSLPESMNSIEFAEHCSRVFGAPVRFTKGKSDHIQTIAMVCGSGSQYMQSALDANVDCFITADVKYHQFHEAKGAIMLLDPGHAEMEQFVVSGMISIIKHDETLKHLTIIGSEVHTSPIQYA